MALAGTANMAENAPEQPPFAVFPLKATPFEQKKWGGGGGLMLSGHKDGGR